MVQVYHQSRQKSNLFPVFFHLSFQFTVHLKLWLRWRWGREWWGCYKAIHFLSATHLWLNSQRSTMAKSVAPLAGFSLRPERDMSSLRGERMSSVQRNTHVAMSALKHTRKSVKHVRKPVHLIKQLELCWYLKQHPQYTFACNDHTLSEPFSKNGYSVWVCEERKPFNFLGEDWQLCFAWNIFGNK